MKSRKSAVVTLARNEAFFLPIWLGYYSQHYDAKDMYILDHESTDGSTTGIAANVRVVCHPRVFDHAWLVSQIQEIQQELLREYETVLFTDTDEIVISMRGSLAGYVERFRISDAESVRCLGYGIIHLPDKEAPYDPDQLILAQRHYWRHLSGLNKPLLSKVPLAWGLGCHDASNAPREPDPELVLLHLHRLDYAKCLEKMAQPGQGITYDLKTEADIHRWLQDGINSPEVAEIPADFPHVI